MVKSVWGVSHQGVRDFIIQRITAILITFCIVGLAYYFVAHPHFSFVEWRMLFAPASIKILTLFMVLSLAFHAWVGIWTVVTDYVKWAFLRLMIHVLVILTLLACFFWSLLIVWGF